MIYHLPTSKNLAAHLCSPFSEVFQCIEDALSQTLGVCAAMERFARAGDCERTQLPGPKQWADAICDLNKSGIVSRARAAFEPMRKVLTHAYNQSSVQVSLCCAGETGCCAHDLALKVAEKILNTVTIAEHRYKYAGKIAKLVSGAQDVDEKHCVVDAWYKEVLNGLVELGAIDGEKLLCDMLREAVKADVQPAQMMDTHKSYTYQQMRKVLRVESSATVNKYAQIAGVQTAGIGKRNHKFSVDGARAILRAFIANSSDTDIVENCAEQLAKMSVAMEIEQKSKDRKEIERAIIG
jgi:hypothetical protein